MDSESCLLKNQTDSKLSTSAVHVTDKLKFENDIKSLETEKLTTKSKATDEKSSRTLSEKSTVAKDETKYKVKQNHDVTIKMDIDETTEKEAQIKVIEQKTMETSCADSETTKVSTPVKINADIVVSNSLPTTNVTSKVTTVNKNTPTQQTSPQITITGASLTPENLLSPPKSETQTDETNTVSSASPASNNSQSSPVGLTDNASSETLSSSKSTTTATDNAASPTPTPTSKPTRTPAVKSTVKSKAKAASAKITKPINVVANGTIPKSGKPLVSAMNKKLNKTTRTRKPKTMVAMYESEISDNKIGIKLCIKKSDTSATTIIASTNTAVGKSTTTSTSTSASTPTPKAPTTTANSTTKQNRTRSRKSKTKARLDSDDSEYETKRKKGATQHNSTERQKKVSFSGIANDELKEPVEQTKWGAQLPEEILFEIFQIIVDKDGCMPTLFRLGRVCSMWRRVSLSPTLWKSMDLTTYIKEKYRTELKLKWFVDNRCSSCTDLNVSNWKMSDINCFLQKLAKGAPNLEGITLSGWKNFTSDHLNFLVDNMKKLERIDLSSVNVEMNASKSAVGLQSLCNALQKMHKRLTHLYLAHNRLAGIPQIVNTLYTYCPNLLLLDLSNVTTQATSHGILHIEKLQKGCQKLKVLRITNSYVTLSTPTMQEMMDSLGFPDLEELSVAALTDESRLIGDEQVQRILKTSSKLKLLDVRGCTRLTHESLIRLPAWDIKHLFLSGCSVTRDMGSGLELIASKWAHSLIELDLAWANVQQPLDNALRALAEKGKESPLAHLNLCGSSVSEEAVKDILTNCTQMSSINLSSCRGLPRGVKRLMQGPLELQELRDVLKVQMKFELTAQLKEEQTATADDNGVGGTNTN